MKFLILFFALGCSATKAKMNGIVLDERMYFDNMVRVRVTNAPDAYMWVRLNKKQMKHVKEGDRVTFYVQTSNVQYEAR